MKKRALLPLCITLAVGAFAPTTQATGVPVVDVANLAQAIETVTQLEQQVQVATQQYTEMVNQLSETKNINTNLTGNWSLSQVFSNDSLNSVLPEDWQSIYSGGASSALREKYGLKTNNSGLQTLYDTNLASVSQLTDLYNAAISRTANIQQLEGLQNSAVTPQQKLDYANKLQYEQTALANEQTKISVTQSLTQEREQLSKQTAAQNFYNKFWN